MNEIEEHRNLNIKEFGEPHLLKIYRGKGYNIYVESFRLTKRSVFRCFTLKIDGKSIGVATVSKLRMLNDVYVDLDYRNKGYATKLITFIMNYYPAKRLDAIPHKDSKISQNKLVKFYSKFGFVHKVGFRLSTRNPTPL